MGGDKEILTLELRVTKAAAGPADGMAAARVRLVLVPVVLVVLAGSAVLVGGVVAAVAVVAVGLLQ